MPTYDYRCTSCDHKFEEFQSMSAKPLKKCPACGKPKLERLIGIGAAIVFKGSGFYQTDYRSESYKKAAEADSGSATPAAGAGAGAEAPKPDAAKGEKSDGVKKEPAAAGAAKADAGSADTAKPPGGRSGGAGAKGTAESKPAGASGGKSARKSGRSKG